MPKKIRRSATFGPGNKCGRLLFKNGYVIKAIREKMVFKQQSKGVALIHPCRLEEAVTAGNHLGTIFMTNETICREYSLL